MPFKNLGENGAWAYPGTGDFFQYPLLSQEWVKLRTSNLAGTFKGQSEQKPIKIWEKRERGVSGDCPNLSHERTKLLPL